MPTSEVASPLVGSGRPPSEGVVRSQTRFGVLAQPGMPQSETATLLLRQINETPRLQLMWCVELCYLSSMLGMRTQMRPRWSGGLLAACVACLLAFQAPDRKRRARHVDRPRRSGSPCSTSAVPQPPTAWMRRRVTTTRTHPAIAAMPILLRRRAMRQSPGDRLATQRPSRHSRCATVAALPYANANHRAVHGRPYSHDG